MKLDTVAIVGVGLIGGSIGLELKKLATGVHVVGVGRRQESLAQALAKGAIDAATVEVEQAVKDADLVILATPVGAIPELAGRAIPHMKSGAILTDVGSTKVEIVQAIEPMTTERVHFVGGHPLAGSEKRGPAYAHEGLFKDRTVVLTPTERTQPGVLSVVTEFWQQLGAKVRTLSPRQHDRILAQVSHLPHLVAAQLVNFVDSGASSFAASAFKDLTRIAASDPEVWLDIYLSNANNVSRVIRQFAERLLESARLVESKDADQLREMLQQAKQNRLKL